MSYFLIKQHFILYKMVDRVITTQPTLTTNICSQMKDSLRLSSVYIIYGIFPHKSIVRNEKNNKQTLKTTFKRAECVFFNHLPHV